jgi:hypothetical protein
VQLLKKPEPEKKAQVTAKVGLYREMAFAGYRMNMSLIAAAGSGLGFAVIFGKLANFLSTGVPIWVCGIDC